MTHVLTLFLVLCAACSKSKPAAEQPAAKRTAADLGPMCERFYAQQRTCVNEYLRALIQVRAEYDMPKGIAAELKEKGLDEMVVLAKVEFERDTAPEKTAQICNAIATKTPADQVDRLLAEGDGCLAIAECGAFAKCAVDTERTYIQSGMVH